MILLLLLTYIINLFLFTYCIERPIIVFVPSYNNIQFYQKNLDSIFSQEYNNYHVIYVDDCSNDGTGDAVEAYIKEHCYQDRITLIRNNIRRGAMYNHYMVAHAIPNHVIIATLDGDDWLPDDNTQVLKRINDAYQNTNIWMTYGQFAEHPSGAKGFCKPMAEWPIQLHMYRDYPWVFSHMRTFYAGLFKQIPVGYFIHDSNFLQATCDLAIMFSLLELAGGRAYCIEDIIYTYNTLNARSDCNTRILEQIHNDHWVRGRKPLQPLTLHPAYELPNTEPILYNWHISTTSASYCKESCRTAIEHGIESNQITIFYHIQSNTDDDYRITGHVLETKTIGIPATNIARSTLLTELDLLPEESYILITTDSCKWQERIDWYALMKTLTQTKALSYVATMSSSTIYDTAIRPTTITLTLLYDEYYLWKPTGVQGLCHHPYASAAYLVSKKNLHRALTLINGNTLAETIDNLSYLAPENNDDVMLCTAHYPCIPSL